MSETTEPTIPAEGRVAVLTEPRHIDVRTLPLPEINDDEVLVRVEGCGICGTDQSEYRADPFGYAPIVLGHEATGEVVKIGKNVTTDYSGKPLKVGDKIVTGLRPCGHCAICKRRADMIHLCENGEIHGLMPGENHFFNGWYSDYMKCNPGAVIFNVNDMPDRDLRILIEPAAVIVHAVEEAKKIYDFKHGSHVLVQGCGPIGLLLVALLKTYGIRNIVAVDAKEARLEMAKRLGATATVNFSDYNSVDAAADAVREVTEGLGAEMGFQCTGSPAAAAALFKYIRRGGSYCEVGFFTNTGDATYNPHLDVCQKEIKLTGSWTYQAGDWLEAQEFLKEAKDRGLPVMDLVTNVFPLDQINEAMEYALSMQGLKIEVVPEL
ncbi:zinc-dependent alcohol dehydrogenase [Bifidobacterium callitrichidarum]|uniref:Theronine dehydrogenase n=1 Tax=Bifidobacterium callitrichidarum TaxID=2052941 RepID=A0A2U2N6P1_9BIFI|nr:zinc-binding dehydrogenase [Bifidobacterium callitrichidarum]PWG64747.1 theronine dehydrogenase [Bifidobacterium callitrichidarum]